MDNSDDETLMQVGRHLIASSSEEEGGEEEDAEQEEGEDGSKEEDAISKYRSLLVGIGQNKGGKIEEEEEEEAGEGMEMSWVPEEDEDEAARQDGNDSLTPWEKFLKKKRDKKKQRKRREMVERDGESEDDQAPSDVDLRDPFFADEMKESSKKKRKKKKDQSRKEDPTDATQPHNKPGDLALLVMDSDDDRNHFDYKTIVEDENTSKSKKKKWKKKNRKSKAEEGVEERECGGDNFDVNVNDERFAAIFNNPDFNIDPSQQNFKKTSGMDKLITEKQKRLVGSGGSRPVAEPKAKKSKLDPELSASLKSVKNKWEKNAKKKSKN